jgi:Ser/Thr protein kinase RdoA (MazF antagonist)
MTREEIQSELIVLNTISQSSEAITVPTGLASLNGILVTEYITENGAPLFVTLMRWLEGELLSSGMTDQQVTNMGVMIGRLHEATSSFVPPAGFVRQTWGSDSFSRDMSKLARYYDRFLTMNAWEKYREAAEKIKGHLTEMISDAANYGFIHADLHVGNVVFQGDEPFPIDFGRCGYGYYLYDLAGMMVGLYPYQRQLLLQGYTSIRAQESVSEEMLSCFFVMIMIENYCNHASDPREISGLIEQQPYAQAIIRDYLNGDPFLFNPIEPIDVD